MISLDIYHKGKYAKKARYDKYDSPTDEDYILLDVECDPKYENINPGTVTVEGFGLECWEYEQKFGEPHGKTIMTSYAEVPVIPAKKILRRLHELKYGGVRLGWDREKDYKDLKEFTGTLGLVSPAHFKSYLIAVQNHSRGPEPCL